MDFKLDKYEEELLSGCLDNKPEMQKALYDRYKDAMYTICYRMMNDDDEAHDVLQDGFIEVFKSLSKFKKQSTLGAWIKTIVVRAALAKIKKQRETVVLHHEQHDQPIIWDENLTGEYLEKGIKELPTGYRAVFTLIEVEGYSHKEVANMLDISEGTSKSQLYHSKKMLQGKLKELMY